MLNTDQDSAQCTACAFRSVDRLSLAKLVEALEHTGVLEDQLAHVSQRAVPLRAWTLGQPLGCSAFRTIAQPSGFRVGRLERSWVFATHGSDERETFKQKFERFLSEVPRKGFRRTVLSVGRHARARAAPGIRAQGPRLRRRAGGGGSRWEDHVVEDLDEDHLARRRLVIVGRACRGRLPTGRGACQVVGDLPGHFSDGFLFDHQTQKPWWSNLPIPKMAEEAPQQLTVASRAASAWAALSQSALPMIEAFLLRPAQRALLLTRGHHPPGS